MPKPAGTSCFWEWIRVGPIPGWERARPASDWKGRWGGPRHRCTFSGKPRERRSRLACGRPWHLALSFLCHLQQVYSCALNSSLSRFSTGRVSSCGYSLKQPGIFNSSNWRETSAGLFFFFPSLSTFQSSCRKDNVISTLFFPHLTSSFQSWGEKWACVVHHKSGSYTQPAECVGPK